MLAFVLDLSKPLKGWRYEIPLKVRGVKPKRGQGRTLMSKTGEPSSMFWIRRPKVGMQDGWL